MSSRTKQIVKELQQRGNADIAAHSQGFFKTGKGEYGEGDLFLGIRVPVIRKWVREYRLLSLGEVLELLKSPFHEVRLLAVLLMVAKYSAKKDKDGKAAIYQAYLSHTRYINNWDIIDTSAMHIVGAHLVERSRKPLFKLARSKNLWERRIGIMATFHFIKKGDFSDTLAIAEILLTDREDLIHKAVGWMLREVGNRDPKVEKAFLNKHYQNMPRTMLRYAIEKFPEAERQAYLKGEV